MSHGRSPESSRLLPRHVIEDHDLNVLIRPNIMTLRIIPRLRLRIHVDHLSIPLILEEKPLLVVWNDLEVRALVRSRVMRIPVEEGQVSRPRQKPFLPLEVRLEQLLLQALAVVDVATHLLAARVLIADEDDRREFPIPHELLARGQVPQERIRRQVLLRGREDLWRVLELRTLGLLRCLPPCGELFAREDLALAAADLHELPREVVLFEVEAILRCDL